MSVRTITQLYLPIAACAAGVAVALATPANAFQLITKSEAALPAARGEHDRGISRGPTIVVVSPPPSAGTMRSPIDMKIEFKPHGGAKINADSVLVTYMKDPTVDLTQRVKPFIETTGIEIKDAEVPPGVHTLRVDVADTYGHEGQAVFSFTVSR